MFSLPSLYGVAGSLGFAMTTVLSRHLRSTSDTILVTTQTLAVMVVGLMLSVFQWRVANLADWLAMLLFGAMGASAHLLSTRALKLAPASLLAPLQYTLLLWAIAFGYAFFGDIPGHQVIAGGAVIVLAGLFIFHGQQVNGQVVDHADPLDGH